MVADPNRKRRLNLAGGKPLVGRSSPVLLLGFLAGLLVGQAGSADLTNRITLWTGLGLAGSLLWVQVARWLRARAAQKALARATTQMERRMERHIPKRRMIAHGIHAHGPHAAEASESQWVPVARRGRAASVPRR